MPENITENQFHQLLQLKFRLKRLSHHQQLSRLELVTLARVEHHLATCQKAREYLDSFGHQASAMVG